MVLPERVPPHDLEQAVCVARRADGDELAFVGDIAGIETEKLAGRGDRGNDRDRRLVEQHSGGRLLRQLIERAGQSAARGIAQHAQFGAAVEHGLDEAV